MTPESAAPAAVAGDWLRDFQPFTLTHAAVIVGFSMATWALVLAGRSRRDTPGQYAFESRVGVVALVLWVIINAHAMWPSNFEARSSLPLHICDLTSLIAPLAMLAPVARQARFRRGLRAILYFWGFGLCTQAFFTPVLRNGPATLDFWFFWLNHFVIVGLAIYDVVVRRFRPTWRDYGLAIVVSLAYLAVVCPIDVMFDLNYGYLGPERLKPGTLMDLLGPWPGRLIHIVIGVALAMLALMVPWVVGKRIRLRASTSEDLR